MGAHVLCSQVILQAEARGETETDFAGTVTMEEGLTSMARGSLGCQRAAGGRWEGMRFISWALYKGDTEHGMDSMNG